MSVKKKKNYGKDHLLNERKLKGPGYSPACKVVITGAWRVL